MWSFRFSRPRAGPSELAAAAVERSDPQLATAAGRKTSLSGARPPFEPPRPWRTSHPRPAKPGCWRRCCLGPPRSTVKRGSVLPWRFEAIPVPCVPPLLVSGGLSLSFPAALCASCSYGASAYRNRWSFSYEQRTSMPQESLRRLAPFTTVLCVFGFGGWMPSVFVLHHDFSDGAMWRVLGRFGEKHVGH